jgi:hypothetical protein
MACSAVSSVFALFHYFLIAIRILKVPFYFSKSNRSIFEDLHCIWRTRVTRRILSVIMRTPLRKSFLSLINFTVPVPLDSGCVIAICHSPWKRILVQWCLENKFGLIVGGGKWSHRKKLIQRSGTGFTDLRNIIRFLQRKGRVILAADVFNSLNNCPVMFLGNKCNASKVYIRLALMAEVPLLIVIPKLTNTSIDFLIGPKIEPGNLRDDVNKKIEKILSFFEIEIESNPSIWSPYSN